MSNGTVDVTLLPEYRIKQMVRERDGFKCFDCGMTQEQHLLKYGSDLQVHRMDKRAAYDLTHCVTLCYPCHGSVKRNPRVVRAKVLLDFTRGNQDIELWNQLVGESVRLQRDIDSVIMGILRYAFEDDAPDFVI